MRTPPTIQAQIGYYDDANYDTLPPGYYTGEPERDTDLSVFLWLGLAIVAFLFVRVMRRQM